MGGQNAMQRFNLHGHIWAEPTWAKYMRRPWLSSVVSELKVEKVWKEQEFGMTRARLE